MNVPTEEQLKSMGWIPATRLASIPNDSGLSVTVGDRRLAFFVENGTVYALDDACLHMGASIGAGDFRGGIVTCPWHGWRFKVADGSWVSCPKNKIRTYPTQIIDEVVYVNLSADPSPSQSP